MKVAQAHMNWGSASNASDSATMMFAADASLAPSGAYQRLLWDEEDMTPPQSDGVQVDHDNFLQNLDDLEQLDWEFAPELIWAPSQHLPGIFEEELQCPPTSQTIPIQFPTVDQSGESTETREENTPAEEDKSADSTACGGEGSYDGVDESSSRPVLPSGKKIGVTYHKKNQQYEAHLWIKGHNLRGRKKKGVQIFLGNYGTEEEAKVAHDRAAIKLNIPPSARRKPYPLNFPEVVHSSYMQEHAHWTARDFLWKIRRTSNKFSKGKSSLKGVTLRKRSVKRGKEWAISYDSKISVTDKESGDDAKRMFTLGNFKIEEEAGQAYDRALLFVHQHLPEVEQLACITNYKPSSYSAEDLESMAGKVQKEVPVVADQNPQELLPAFSQHSGALNHQ